MNYKILSKIGNQKAINPSELKKKKMEFIESEQQKVQEEEFPLNLQTKLMETHNDSFKDEKEIPKLPSKSLSTEKITNTVYLDDKSVQFDQDSFQNIQREIKTCFKIPAESSHSSKMISQDKMQLLPLKSGLLGSQSNILGLKSATGSFFALQALDLARSSLGKKAIQAFCSNFHIGNLQSLNLSENPIGDDGIKFIAESPYWNGFESLILNHIEIGFQGAKWLAQNESWKKLKELHLNQNPLIGSLGALSLSLNRTWTNLKSLSLWGCNLDNLGMTPLRQKRSFRTLLTKDNPIDEEGEFEHPLQLSRKDHATHETLSVPRIAPNSTTLEKKSLVSSSQAANKSFQYSKNYFRGGCPEGVVINSSGILRSKILEKLQQYNERILKDEKNRRELDLFVEVLAHSDPTNYCNHKRKNFSQDEKSEDIKSNNEDQNNENSCDCGFVELTYDIKKNFLGHDSSKILHITGEAGIGKSMFCKHLQREMLSDWKEPQTSETDNQNWFPIYFGHSSLKYLKSKAILEALKKELYLTEEEISLIQTADQNDVKLPHLLFIFDGYDEIEDSGSLLQALNSDQDVKDNNFCVTNNINEANWKNSKFIITSREESLQRVQQRDFIFAPLNTNSEEVSVIRGSFLQRKMELFSNKQITSYLKKSFVLRQIPKMTLSSQSSASWNLIKRFEEKIDEYKLREVARVPFMLKVIVDVLPDIVAADEDQGTDFNSTPSKRSSPPSNLFLIDCFINKIIKSVCRKEGKREEQEENFQQRELHSTEKMKLQLQSLALRLSNYLQTDSEPVMVTEDNSLLLELYPLVEWDSKSSKTKFGNSLLQDFCVSKCIEEEFFKFVGELQHSSMEIVQMMHFIQRLLTSQVTEEEFFKFVGELQHSRMEIVQKMRFFQRLLTSQVTLFLRDSLKDQRIKSDQLMYLVMLSRRNEGVHQQEASENIPADSGLSRLFSAFSVAAANSIMILNSFGYDFGGHDLSNICIPGANLSYGMFEATNFANADLRGVDFTGAWLKDASFVHANLKNVNLGEIPNLKLNNEEIMRIAYSPNGKYLALDADKETLIFEKSWTDKSCFKEINRLRGSIKFCKGDCFSKDDQKLYTVRRAEDLSLYVWDIITGELHEKFNVPIGNKQLINFEPDKKQIIALEDGKIQKYNIASNAWIQCRVAINNQVTNCDLSSDSKIGIVGDYRKKTVLFSLYSGNSLHKQTEDTTFCKFSSDGKQFVTGTSEGDTYISDSIRGCTIKYQKVEKDNRKSAINNISFTLDGRQILSLTSIWNLTLHDITDSKSVLLKGRDYALHSDRKQIALRADLHTISFKNLTLAPKSLNKIEIIRGTNEQGLNIKGAVVNGSFGLSDQNILLFQEKGDYDVFDKNMMRKLIPANPEDAENIREIVIYSVNLTPIHARIIENASHWINLETLDLRYNKISDEGAGELSKNTTWTNLQTLDLRGNGIGDEGARELSKNTTWTNLQTLDLSQNKIGVEGVEELSKNTTWTNLQTLKLDSNKIGDEGLRKLSKNTTWTNLQTLNLWHNNISDEGVRELSKNTTWTNLQTLDLFLNSIRVEGVEELSKNTTWTNLQTLNLSHNNIGDEGVSELRKNTTWTNLQTLNLSRNNIGVEGVRELSKKTTWINLQTLYLSENNIGDEGVRELIKNTTWTNLQTLDLSKNKIGIEGVRELSKNTTWTNLQTLDLRSNNIGKEGVRELSKNTIWKNLQTLDLSWNNIGDEGVRELSKNTTWTNLQTLKLYSNKIGKEQVEKLKQNLSWPHLQNLHI